jgi:hypothetical protein
VTLSWQALPLKRMASMSYAGSAPPPDWVSLRRTARAIEADIDRLLQGYEELRSDPTGLGEGLPVRASRRR